MEKQRDMNNEKFAGKYRIPSARAAWWDYGNNGAYFVTICTAGHRHFFGTIIDERMVLNDLGKIVHDEWVKTIEVRKDMNLQMDEFVVMPNHFHAIIIIGDNEYNSTARRDATLGVSDAKSDVSEIRPDVSDSISAVLDGQSIHPSNLTDVPNRIVNQGVNDAKYRIRDAKRRVSTEGVQMNNRFGPQSKNLASIIRGFKSAVTTQVRLIDLNFKWQERFHDHIIRDDEEYRMIAHYIVNNPANWRKDKFYSE